MTLDMILAAATLVVVLFICIRETIPVHLAAMAGFAFVVAVGLVGQDQMLSVFSNSAPFTIACMFVITAAIERSGILQIVVRSVGKMAQTSPLAAISSLYGLVAFLSGFVNNTPVVLLIAPMLSKLGAQMRIPASKLLIPLSYAAILGGMCTLIGTSTNLLVDGIAQEQGLEPFGMFELTPAGLVTLVAGFAFMFLIGRFILPVRRPLREDLSEARAAAMMYTTDILIGEDSPHLDKTLTDIGARDKFAEEIVDLARPLETEEAPPAPLKTIISQLLQRGMRKKEVPVEVKEPENQSSVYDVPLRPGFRINFRATRERISEIREFFSAKADAEEDVNAQGDEPTPLTMADILITTGSTFNGMRLGEIWMLPYYGLEVVALHRKGHHVAGDLNQTKLMQGDILVVEGQPDTIDLFLNNAGLVRASTDPDAASTWRAVGSIGCLVVVIAVAALNIMPIASAALVGAVVLLLLRFIDLKDAYRAIQWPILMLIYGMLGISLAFEGSGAAKALVDFVISLIGDASPIVILSCFYLLTSFLTEIMSNNAAAVILTPLAIGIAQTLGVDPRPFVVAVMLGASASFATPMGYQTNAYVYGIGNYRFTDFLKIGTPMNLIGWAVATFVIPLIWPL